MKISIQGLNHPNQDAVGSYKKTFWVLDGATPLFEQVLGGFDVERTVRMVSSNLTRHGNSNMPLVDLLDIAVDEAAQEFRMIIPYFDSIERYRLPTFACALGRIEGDELSYLILADCEIRTSTGKRLTDPSFLKTSAANQENEREILRKYGAENLEDLGRVKRKKALTEIWELNEKQRMKLNTPEGYWIGSLDGAGILHAFQGKIRLEADEHVYAMSDGFAHLVDADPEILNISSDNEMRTRINELRNVTDDDVSMVAIR